MAARRRRSWQLVEDFQVIHQRGMKARPEDGGGLPGFAQADAFDGFGIMLRGAATAGGQIEAMNFVTGLLEQQKRPGHHEFDVVGMGGNGQCDLSHLSGHATNESVRRQPELKWIQIRNGYTEK